jgi:predicted  nucleic acid-binding Zn-ribbon protein
MKIRNIVLLMCLGAVSVIAAGCGSDSGSGGSGGSDTAKLENKPLDEIKAAVEKMGEADLKKWANKYKDAIVSKQQDMKKIEAKLKEIPLTEALGDEAKALKGDIDEITKSISALRRRFDIYYSKLKEMGADVSQIEL